MPGSGRWKLGDKPFHGYYTAILVREGDQAKIMEETVTIAALSEEVDMPRLR